MPSFMLGSSEKFERNIRVRCSPSTPFKYEFLYVDYVHLYLRSPSSWHFTKGHTKLQFAVFVVRLANPFSHEAFS
ncbi:hypothetical protein L195_g031415, partial [Trifolium pratense]